MPFRYFVVSSFRLALLCGQKQKKNEEITKKKRNNARRRDEITISAMRKTAYKREKTKKRHAK